MSMHYIDDTSASGKYGDNLTWTYDEKQKVLDIDGSGPMLFCSIPWEEWKDEIETVFLHECSLICAGSVPLCLAGRFLEGRPRDDRSGLWTAVLCQTHLRLRCGSDGIFACDSRKKGITCAVCLPAASLQPRKRQATKQKG